VRQRSNDSSQQCRATEWLATGVPASDTPEFSTRLGDRYRVLVDIQTYVCALLFHVLPAAGTFWFGTRRAQEAAGTEENIYERCQKAKCAVSERVR